MSITVNSWLAALCAALTASAYARAQPSRTQTPSAIAARQSTADRDTTGGVGKIRFGRPSAVPNGYYAMCVSPPNLCRVRAGRVATTRDGSVELTGAMMDRLNSVNASVNASIRPAYGGEWTPERPVGDCKDFAMTKRQRLIDSGWPTSALPVAVVHTSSGGAAPDPRRPHQPRRLRPRQFERRDRSVEQDCLLLGEDPVDDQRHGVALFVNVEQSVAVST